MNIPFNTDVDLITGYTTFTEKDQIRQWDLAFFPEDDTSADCVMIYLVLFPVYLTRSLLYQ